MDGKAERGERFDATLIFSPATFNDCSQKGTRKKEGEKGKTDDFYVFLNFGTIVSVPWQARIVEVREEIDRVLSQTADNFHKADSIPRLLQDKQLDRIG